MLIVGNLLWGEVEGLCVWISVLPDLFFCILKTVLKNKVHQFKTYMHMFKFWETTTNKCHQLRQHGQEVLGTVGKKFKNCKVENTCPTNSPSSPITVPPLSVLPTRSCTHTVCLHAALGVTGPFHHPHHVLTAVYPRLRPQLTHQNLPTLVLHFPRASYRNDANMEKEVFWQHCS